MVCVSIRKGCPLKKVIAIFLLLFANQAFAYHLSGHVKAFADLLVWQLSEGSADNWAQLIAGPGVNRPIKVIDVPFSYSVGARIGASYLSPQNEWDITAIYTRYQTSASRVASGEVYSSYLGNFYAGNTDGAKYGPFYSEGNIQWDFGYNTADIEAGHTFKIDQALSLHPFFGLKAAWIDQNIHTSWQNPHSPNVSPPITYNFVTATEQVQQNFFGIGPTLGVNTWWPLYKNAHSSFGLIGDFLLGLLWGHWSFKDVYQNDAATTITVNSSDINGGSPMSSGFLGIGWQQTYLKSEINVRLGYEAQVWFNQMQYYVLSMGRLNHTMSLQGATLTMSMSFA